MQRIDVVLLLLYARGKTMKDNESVPSLTHLQKEMFLLQRILPYSQIEYRYEFAPLWYGPFSKELSIDVNSLQDDGLLTAEIGITLSPAGFRKASSLWHQIDDEHRTVVIQVKERFNRMSLEELLDYVYNHFPKLAKKSALKKEVVDEYFDTFWKENGLSDQYFVDAVRAVRNNQ